MDILHFRHIRTKMLACILPIILISCGLLTTVSIVASRSTIKEQIDVQMDAKLSAEASKINAYIEEISNTSMAISRMVTGTFKNTKIDDFLDSLSVLIFDNPLILGSGLWFEPYAYDSGEKYCGPYVYKDGNRSVMTWDYSNEEYDYFNQEYYTMTRGSTGPKVTDPYYDETSNCIMSSTSAPMFDMNKKYIGCVTVDMELSAIQSMVSNIKVGETGSAILLARDGTYIYDKDSSKVSKSMNIKNDPNRSLADSSRGIFSENKGLFLYKDSDGKEQAVFHLTLDKTGWILLLQRPMEEINAPVYKLLSFMSTICVIVLIAAVVILLLLVRSITVPIVHTMNFSKELSEGSGDLTYQIQIEAKNEIGDLVKYFNKFINSQRSMISELKVSESSLETVARELASSSQESAGAIAQIMANIQGVRHQTEQQQETFEEVSRLLANNIEKIEELDKQIAMENDSISTSSSAIEQMIGNINSVTDSVGKMSKDFDELTRFAVDGKQLQNLVGEKITNMAEQSNTLVEANNTISSVASQTNLLAMNAAIEAAHAGSAGQGFSVVAEEIRKLAEDTSKQSQAIGQQIKSITSIISDVVSASGGAQKSFAKIEERINVISTLVSEVNNAMDEQSTASKQVLNSLAEMTNSSSVVKSTAKDLSRDSVGIQRSLSDLTQVVQTVNSSMDEMALGAKDINDSAQKIADMTEETNNSISALHNLVKKFKTE